MPEAREQIFTVRLNKTESETFQKAAEKRGWNKAQLMREWIRQECRVG